MGLRDHLVLLVQLVLRVQPDLPAQLAQPAPAEMLAQLAQLDLRGQLVRRDQPVRLVILEAKAQQEDKAHKDRLVHRGPRVIQEIQVRLDLLVVLDQLDQLDLLAPLGLLALRAIPETQEEQAQLVHLVPQDPAVRQVEQALQARKAILALQDQQVQQVHKARLVGPHSPIHSIPQQETQTPALGKSDSAVRLRTLRPESTLTMWTMRGPTFKHICEPSTIQRPPSRAM